MDDTFVIGSQVVYHLCVSYKCTIRRSPCCNDHNLSVSEKEVDQRPDLDPIPELKKTRYLV